MTMTIPPALEGTSCYSSVGFTVTVIQPSNCCPIDKAADQAVTLEGTCRPICFRTVASFVVVCWCSLIITHWCDIRRSNSVVGLSSFLWAHFSFISENIAMRGYPSVNIWSVNIYPSMPSVPSMKCEQFAKSQKKANNLLHPGNANNLLNPGKCEQFAKSYKMRTICLILENANNLLNPRICEQFAKCPI